MWQTSSSQTEQTGQRDDSIVMPLRIRLTRVDVLPFDLLEKILAQLDVTNLLKYKSVCKSWYSLISSSRFVKAHLNHTCNKEHRKIAITEAACKSLTALFRKTRHHIVGSSNGLLCIYLCDNELEVANPHTAGADLQQRRVCTCIPSSTSQ
ncbi:F-box protein CPR30-like protein isoform X1 [Tanacetum coccineum]